MDSSGPNFKVQTLSDEETSPLECMPNEILIHILSFLDTRFVLEVVSLVSLRLQNLIADDSLWKIRTKRRLAKNSSGSTGGGQYPPIDPTCELKWRNICAEQEEFFNLPQEDLVKAEVKGHYASIDALLLVPFKSGQKELLVSGSRDRSVGLWDPSVMLEAQTSAATAGQPSKTSGLLQKIDVHKGWVWSLSTNLEDQVISCGWDNMIFKWSFRESEMVQDLRINCKTACLCSTYVGDIVSIGSFDRKVKTFDLRTPNKQVEQYSHHKMPVLDVLTPRHHPHLLLTAGEDGILASIDRRNRKLLRKLNFGAASFPMSMAVVDGDNCLYVGDKKGGLRLIDATGGNLKTVRTIESLHSGKIVGVDASHAGVVTCSSDKTVKLLHPDLDMTTHHTFDVKDHGEVTSVSHSALTGILAMGHSQETIQVYSSKEINGHK